MRERPWRWKTLCRRSWTVRSLSGRGRIGQRGASRVGCLLLILLLAAGAYAGFVFIESEFAFRSLRAEVERQAGLASQFSDDEIRRAVQGRARELGLPQRAEAVTVTRITGRHIRISLSYTDTLTFLNRWDVVRPRHIELQRSF